MVFHDANNNAQVDPGEAILLHQAALPNAREDLYSVQQRHSRNLLRLKIPLRPDLLELNVRLIECLRRWR